MDQVPSVLRTNAVSERRHGATVHAGHECPVEMVVGAPALPLVAGSEVKRLVGEPPIVPQRWSRGSVALALRPVALLALVVLPDDASPLARGVVVGRLRRNDDGGAGRFFLPLRRERLQVFNDGAKLRLPEDVPEGHVRVVQPGVERSADRHWWEAFRWAWTGT